MQDETLKKKLLAGGTDWYTDRYEAVKVERNRYLLLLVVCFIALIVSLVANLMLSPLKTAVPYVIEVDKSTGVTSVLKPATTESMRQQEAVTVYFLYKYLNARMSYDYALRKNNANAVRALSTASAWRQYAQQIDTANPNSPIQLYKNTATRSIHIESYSFPYPDIAEMRFYTELRSSANANNAAPLRQYWIATLKYTYADVALSLSDRENINPLGFFVSNFQLNQEVPGGRK